MERIWCLVSGSIGSCLVSIPTPSFFFILLNLEWNRCWTSWGIMFWIDWLIINSTEELSFRDTEFQGLSFKDLSLFIVTGYECPIHKRLLCVRVKHEDSKIR